MPEEDYFADWYELEGVEKYTQKYKLMQTLNTLARGLHVSQADAYAKEDFDDILERITNKILEEPEYLQVAAGVINGMYPGLAGEFRSAPSAEELSEFETDEYNKELMKIEQSVES
ncbi:unnamed protein product, partial [marine sediment metagenome]